MLTCSDMGCHCMRIDTVSYVGYLKLLANFCFVLVIDFVVASCLVVCLFVYLSVHLCVCMSACLCLSVCVCLSVCLSVY